MGDAVALLLAEQELAREVGALGEVGEHVAQQQAARWTLRPDSSRSSRSSSSVRRGDSEPSRATLARSLGPDAQRSQVFHRRFTDG